MPTFNSFLSAYDAALPPYQAGLSLSVPRLIPLIVGSLQLRAYDVMYTPDSAYGAIQALREIQVSVITGITTLDATYRLLNTVYRGIEYEEVSPGVIEPVIEPFVPVDWNANSVLSMLQNMPRVYWLLDNLVNGTVISGIAEDDRNFRQQLEDIIAALTAGDPLSDDMLAVLVQIRDNIGAP